MVRFKRLLAVFLIISLLVAVLPSPASASISAAAVVGVSAAAVVGACLAAFGISANSNPSFFKDVANALSGYFADITYINAAGELFFKLLSLDSRIFVPRRVPQTVYNALSSNPTSHFDRIVDLTIDGFSFTASTKYSNEISKSIGFYPYIYAQHVGDYYHLILSPRQPNYISSFDYLGSYVPGYEFTKVGPDSACIKFSFRSDGSTSGIANYNSTYVFPVSSFVPVSLSQRLFSSEFDISLPYYFSDPLYQSWYNSPVSISVPGSDASDYIPISVPGTLEEILTSDKPKEDYWTGVSSVPTSPLSWKDLVGELLEGQEATITLPDGTVIELVPTATGDVVVKPGTGTDPGGDSDTDEPDGPMIGDPVTIGLLSGIRDSLAGKTEDGTVIKDSPTTVLNSIQSTIASIPDTIINYWNTFSQALSKALSDITAGLAAMRDAILDAFAALKTWLTELIKSISKILSDIWEWLKTLPGILYDSIVSALSYVFVPTAGYFDGKVDALTARFNFYEAIIATAQYIKSLFTVTTEPPVIYMHFGNASSGLNWGGSVAVLDLHFYEPYKGTMDIIISAFLWLAFAWRVYLKLPAFIHGSSGVVGDSISFSRRDDK